MKYHLDWSNGIGFLSYQETLLRHYPYWNTYLIQFLALKSRYVYVIYEDNTKIVLVDNEEASQSQPLQLIKQP